ncbi:MAG: DNA-directed RNA polymerase subunit omega [Treponema sp.]|jgi:DNA-directed RNA polymerase subunit omega|nr:DNA-directed RNA polymerase subunit omega [Treponema sp.]
MESIFPLEQLIGFTGNIYQITVAASRRAYQMSKIKDPELERNAGKAVSLGARQLFCNKVSYRIDDGNK